MKKIIVFIALMMLTLASICSCLVVTPPGEDENEGYARIIRNGTDVPVTDVRDGAFGVSGKMLAVYDDTEPATAGEIVLGVTNRAVTRAAKAALEAAYTDDEDCGYIIYASGGSVAVYWTEEMLMDAALDLFVALCINEKQLVLSDGVVAKEAYSFSELTETVRWAELEAVAGVEITTAFKRMVDFYGDNVYLWMADLYDPEVGGFYYSNSARDHAGFLPDIESTRQILGFVRDASGLTDHLRHDLTQALPADVTDAIVNFVKSMQDPDGYFYHVQWGKAIGSTRQGRDLSSGKNILSWLGEEPNYPYASDRLAEEVEGVSSVKPTVFSVTRLASISAASAVSKIVPTAGIMFEGKEVPQGDDRFASLENWMFWLRYMTQDMQNNNTANSISAIFSQAAAAGYTDATIEHLNSLQTAVYEKMVAAGQTPTGLWSTEVDYSSISCLMKLSGIYTGAGRTLQYPREIVASMIQSIKFPPDDPAHPVVQMNHIYNTWSGLEDIPIGYQQFGNDPALVEELFEMIRADAPAMIYNTINKLNVFRKEDGSFSYYPKYSADVTNGTIVALPEQEEGDVNSTVMALGIYQLMYRALGFKDYYVPIYTRAEYDIFHERISTAPTIEKTMLTSAEPMDYDSMPYAIYKTSFASDGSLEIIEDPTDPYNNVLAYVTKPVASGGDVIYYQVHGNDDTAECFVFETDMYLASANRELIYQINFGSKTDSKQVAYMLRVRCAGGRIIVDDASSGTTSAKVSNLGISAPMAEWFNFRIEYYPDVEGEVKVKAYLNGDWVGESSNYYDADVVGADPVRVFECVSIRAMVAADAALYLDNTVVATSDKKYDADGDMVVNYDTWGYDFESMLTPPAFSGSYDRATVKTDGDGNKYLHTEGLRTTEQQSGGNIFLPLAMTSDPERDVRRVNYDFMIFSGDANGNGVENEFVGDFLVDNHTGAVVQTSIGYNDAYCVFISAEFDKEAPIAGNYRLSLDGSGGAKRGDMTLELDTVYTITVETDFSDPTAPALRIYVDGALYIETDATGFKSVDAYESDGAIRFGIHNMKRTVCSAYYDNVELEYGE